MAFRRSNLSDNLQFNDNRYLVKGLSEGDQTILGSVLYQGATAIPGYVLTSSDDKGTLVWGPPVGSTGMFGTTGIQGSQGHTGVEGPTGTRGLRGFTGLANFLDQTNYTSTIGRTPVLLFNETDNALFAGISGSEAWVQISQGSMSGGTGLKGPTGVRGETGFGVPGATGIYGPTGLRGPTGVIGPVGLRGVTGLRGMTGAGIQGVPGATGITYTSSSDGTCLVFTDAQLVDQHVSPNAFGQYYTDSTHVKLTAENTWFTFPWDASSDNRLITYNSNRMIIKNGGDGYYNFNITGGVGLGSTYGITHWATGLFIDGSAQPFSYIDSTLHASWNPQASNLIPNNGYILKLVKDSTVEFKYKASLFDFGNPAEDGGIYMFKCSWSLYRIGR